MEEHIFILPSNMVYMPRKAKVIGNKGNYNLFKFPPINPTPRHYPAFEKPTPINTTCLVWYFIQQAHRILPVSMSSVFLRGTAKRT